MRHSPCDLLPRKRTLGGDKLGEVLNDKYHPAFLGQLSCSDRHGHVVGPTISIRVVFDGHLIGRAANPAGTGNEPSEGGMVLLIHKLPDCEADVPFAV